MSMAWKIKRCVCVNDDGGGDEAVLCYRTLWSHAKQRKCTSVHWILESETALPQYKGLIFSLDIVSTLHFLGVVVVWLWMRMSLLLEDKCWNIQQSTLLQFTFIRLGKCFVPWRYAAVFPIHLSCGQTWGLCGPGGSCSRESTQELGGFLSDHLLLRRWPPTTPRTRGHAHIRELWLCGWPGKRNSLFSLGHECWFSRASVRNATWQY